MSRNIPAALIPRRQFGWRACALPAFAMRRALGQSRILAFDKAIGPGWRPGKPGWMSFVAFRQDGAMVASDAPAAPDDVSGGLTIWSFPEGRLIRRLPMRPAAISSDFKYVAGREGVAEIASGKIVLPLDPNENSCHAFSQDNRLVAESSAARRRDGQIRILDLASGRHPAAFGKNSPFAIAISPDRQTLASGYWDAVTLWDLSTRQVTGVLKGFGRYVRGLSFSRDGRLLAAGTDLGGVQVWDVNRRSRVASVTIEGGEVSRPEFSRDGRLVAAGVYGTGAVWLADAASGMIVDHQKVSDLGCGSVAFSPDGRFLIAPSTGDLVRWPYDRGGTIRVFRVATA